MAQHDFAFAQRTGRWLPTGLQTRRQQFFRARLMIPHDDRRDRAVSGRAIHQPNRRTPRHKHFVRVFIQRNRFLQAYGWRLPIAPRHQFHQGAVRGYSFPERGERIVRQLSVIGNLHDCRSVGVGQGDRQRSRFERLFQLSQSHTRRFSLGAARIAA